MDVCLFGLQVRLLNRVYKISMAYYFTGAFPVFELCTAEAQGCEMLKLLDACCWDRATQTGPASIRSTAAGDEFWAERAATKIQKFFLDDRTGMLPSLLYAQLKPELSDVGAPTVSTNQSNRSVRTCKHMCRMYWHQILH